MTRGSRRVPRFLEGPGGGPIDGLRRVVVEVPTKREETRSPPDPDCAIATIGTQKLTMVPEPWRAPSIDAFWGKPMNCR